MERGFPKEAEENPKPAVEKKLPLDPEVAERIRMAENTHEILDIIYKAGGIAQSDGKKLNALEVNSVIVQLLKAKSAGVESDSPMVNMVLGKITRNGGLRDKVKELVFG